MILLCSKMEVTMGKIGIFQSNPYKMMAVISILPVNILSKLQVQVS